MYFLMGKEEFVFKGLLLRHRLSVTLARPLIFFLEAAS